MNIPLAEVSDVLTAREPLGSWSLFGLSLDREYGCHTLDQDYVPAETKLQSFFFPKSSTLGAPGTSASTSHLIPTYASLTT